MSKKKSAYEQLGVSATKEDVHRAIENSDAGLYPGAFCRIAEDLLGGSKRYCSALHCDGAGTKALVAYLHFKTTGDASVFRGIAQDAIVMNLDDLACVGATDKFLLANAIARNSFYVPGEVIKEVVQGYQDFCAAMEPFGIEIIATGGETADLVDNVRTIVVDATLATRLRRDRVIDNSKISKKDVIVALSSTGQTNYETVPNSGIGSNGLTLARHALLTKRYAETHPETISPEIPQEAVYRGPFLLHDYPDEIDMTIGSALLSPTRTYAPVLRAILREVRNHVHGIVHCTGGGVTKCLNFGHGIHYIKNNLFPTPPLFKLIAQHGQVDGREMLQTFNLGQRMELFVTPRGVETVLAVAEDFNLEARIIGECRENTESKGNRLTVESEFGNHEFTPAH